LVTHQVASSGASSSVWRSGALEWRTQRQQHDLHSMKGEGGVVNIRNGRKIVEVEADSHDEHGHGGHH